MAHNQEVVGSNPATKIMYGCKQCLLLCLKNANKRSQIGPTKKYASNVVSVSSSPRYYSNVSNYFFM
jgi:3-hydroxymyristoyl/3-hydroxydecanoyl-(acyl carrier protein) dehydratase